MKSILDAFDLSGEQSGVAGGGAPSAGGRLLPVTSPIDGAPLTTIRCAAAEDVEKVVARSAAAFLAWRRLPAPGRGEVVRRIAQALRERKRDLGALVSLEMGKIRAEGEGEVQEMIDIADFAVGQSRMLYGLTLPSERPDHRMFEQWLPLGPVGVITSFNFPVAPWAWNAMIALIAGDTVVWKPSSKAALCAVAVMKVVEPVLRECGAPEGVLSLLVGSGGQVGHAIAADRRIALVSATGSVAMGRRVARTVAERFGRTILELGGNNAVIVTATADLDLAVPAIVFGAVGTAGQRCTTIRRVIVHEDMFDPLVARLTAAYRQVKIGNPLDEGVLMGPLIDRHAVAAMQTALDALKHQGGRVICGGQALNGSDYAAGTYVTPCICEAGVDMAIVGEETFAPILYLIRYRGLESAIAHQNAVSQGLSSAIFTTDLREAELFLSQRGSDCGIANVNIGTSGAEIGGAFGGEKETGGGRESGSDAWKAYMRRQTCTVNWSRELPLAQGIRFSVDGER